MRHNLKQKNKLELETVLNITTDVKTWS
jgi:hypothetical protein